MTGGHPGELPPPEPSLSDPGAREVLRAWIVAGGLQVSLKPAFEDPAAWGIMLVDVARHVARAYGHEAGHDEVALLASIRDMFDAEWDRPTDLGETRRGGH